MKYTILLFFTCLTTFVWGQSKTISRFQEKHQSGQSLFFYPSTLRMINMEKNPDYYQLVSHVDKLQLLTFDKKENNISSSAVKQLWQDIQNENYQELLSMDDQTRHVRIYALGDDEPEGIVGVIDQGQALTLVEMEGFIHMPSLLKLMQSDFNFGKITQLMNSAVDQENQDQKQSTHSN